MPTTRTRRSRTRRAMPPELRPVFGFGMGWSGLDQAWIQEQWNQYGPAFLATWNGNNDPFALKTLGSPK